MESNEPYKEDAKPPENKMIFHRHSTMLRPMKKMHSEASNIVVKNGN